MARVFVLGMAVLDHVFFLPELPQGALKHRAERYRAIVGGVAANAAVAVSRLGGEASLVARFGDDANARTIQTELAAEDVDTSLCRRTPGAITSLSSVLVDGAGERQIVNFRGAGLDDDVSWLRGETLHGFDAVLVDTRWPEAAARALGLAREIGIPGVVDAEPPFDTCMPVLEAASHVALPAQGLRALVDGADLADGVARLRPRFDAWICVTDGANGVWYTADGGVVHRPALSVKAVDSLAAGDIWHGAFALALAEGRDEEQAVAFAGATASLKCAAGSGWPSIPAREDVEAALGGP